MVRSVIGGLLGGLAMYIIGFIFWGTPLSALAFSRAGDQESANLQAALAQGLNATGTGVYVIPDPATAIAEMVRVLRPGRRIAVMVPTAGRAASLIRLLPNGGAHAFGDDELADIFESLGLSSVRAKNTGTIQWVRGVKAA